MDKNKLAQLQAQLDAAKKNVAANQQKVDELQEKLDAINIRLDRAQRDYQYAKATYDHDRYEFESLRAGGSSSAAEKGEAVAELEKRLIELDLRGPEADRPSAPASQKELEQYTGQVATIAKQIEELHTEETRLQKLLDTQSRRALTKDYFRNAPLLDFMAPTLKVQQLILPNVVDDVNFIRVPKMDRCGTCHLGDRQEGLRESTRSRSRRIRICRPTSAATRRIRSTGSAAPCATRGWGSRSASATRRTRRATRSRRRSGRRTYHWEEPHLWDYPMLPKKMTEASCAKCHKQQVYVPKAENLNLAYATYERAGCYACHKTKGFDTDVKKPGPILTKIDSKLTADWVKTWIRNPQGRQAGHLDAARLVQLELQLAGGRGPQRGRDQRGRPRICSPTPRSTSSPSRTRRAATRQPASGSSRGSRRPIAGSAAWAATWSAKARAKRPARAAPSASRWRTSATRRPTSGCSTGCAIRSTTTRAPTCRTCA